MNLDPEIGSSELDRRMMAALDKQLTQARETNTRLHRRCQMAEAAALQNVEACQRAGVSIGRALAHWAASHYQRMAEQAEARVTELQARGTELVLENRGLRAQLPEPGPRRVLWSDCPGCGERTAPSGEGRHGPDCAARKRNGNGAAP